jgi:hypothetical protein
MTNTEEQFKALAARARGESPPPVDVTDRVMAILADSRSRPVYASEKPWMWLAALSSAVAVPVGLLTFLVYDFSSDPLAELAQAISWVMQ